MATKIGEVAQAFGLTLRALRFYEDKKLIAPERRGTTRLYSDADIARIGLIVDWKRAGFSLAQIHELMAMRDAGQITAMQQFIQSKLQAFEDDASTQLAAVQSLKRAFSEAA